VIILAIIVFLSLLLTLVSVHVFRRISHLVGRENWFCHSLHHWLGCPKSVVTKLTKQSPGSIHYGTYGKTQNKIKFLSKFFFLKYWGLLVLTIFSETCSRDVKVIKIFDIVQVLAFWFIFSCVNERIMNVFRSNHKTLVSLY